MFCTASAMGESAESETVGGPDLNVERRKSGEAEGDPNEEARYYSKCLNVVTCFHPLHGVDRSLEVELIMMLSRSRLHE